MKTIILLAMLVFYVVGVASQDLAGKENMYNVAGVTDMVIVPPFIYIVGNPSSSIGDNSLFVFEYTGPDFSDVRSALTKHTPNGLDIGEPKPRSIVHSRGYLYVVGEGKKLIKIDVQTNRTNPVVTDVYTTSAVTCCGYNWVTVSDKGFAYIAADRDGIVVHDVNSPPAEGVILNNTAATGRSDYKAKRVTVDPQNNILYASYYYQHVKSNPVVAIDVSTPMNPVKLTMRSILGDAYESQLQLSLDAKTLFVTNDELVAIWNVSDKSALTQLSTWNYGSGDYLIAVGVDTAGKTPDNIFVVDSKNGMRRVNVSNLSKPATSSPQWTGIASDMSRYLIPRMFAINEVYYLLDQSGIIYVLENEPPATPAPPPYTPVPGSTTFSASGTLQNLQQVTKTITSSWSLKVENIRLGMSILSSCSSSSTSGSNSGFNYQLSISGCPDSNVTQSWSVTKRDHFCSSCSYDQPAVLTCHKETDWEVVLRSNEISCHITYSLEVDWSCDNTVMNEGVSGKCKPTTTTVATPEPNMVTSQPLPVTSIPAGSTPKPVTSSPAAPTNNPNVGQNVTQPPGQNVTQAPGSTTSSPDPNKLPAGIDPCDNDDVGVSIWVFVSCMIGMCVLVIIAAIVGYCVASSKKQKQKQQTASFAEVHERELYETPQAVYSPVPDQSTKSDKSNSALYQL
eukprot:TRINITY_DN149_c4_g1_i3.p1 TRINITY_DN149_c4_g1~~TRINITY_DN149_c4_g1_i3.p1  ORF type:complete len:678 (+),score=116.67 TRINITY_DN149_c4_g1_i3:2035-4068(+)